MKEKLKIVACAGSLRAQSFNKRVVQAAAQGAESAGAEVTFIDLLDYPMPIYNQDDQDKNGFDESALKFQALLAEADGLLLASPEYNGSLSAALKNAIDWASRPSPQYKASDVFGGKVAAIMTASPGSFGGLRALAHLRGVLTSCGLIVLPQEISVTFASEKIDSATLAFKDEKTKALLENLGVTLVQTLKKIHGIN